MKSEAEVVEQLEALYQAHRPELGEFPWEEESDRWNELVVSTWIGGLRIDAALARDGARRLMDAGLSGPLAWSQTADTDRVFCQRALARAGFTEDQAATAIQIAYSVSTCVAKAYGDRFQLMLRRAGERLRAELCDLLAATGLTKPALEKASTLWLQNVANMPLLLEHDPHIEEFCRHFELTHEELVDLCDRLGLNVAVLDDLLAANQEAKAYLSTAVEPSE